MMDSNRPPARENDAPAGAVPGDRRRRRHDVKREAVLAAALELFNTRGFRATSLDDVAARLGVTKPTIYHYIGSKDEILFDCVKRGLNMVRDAAESVHARGGTGRDRLEALMHSYALAMTQDYCRCVTRTADSELTEDSRRAFRKLKREIDDMVRAVVQAGMDDGSIRAGDARIVTFTLTGSLNWIGRWFEPSRQISAEAAAAGVVATLMAGLATRPAQDADAAAPASTVSA
ncbi:MAG: TetR/AcrR family transcriptional regulator [Paracoccus sp. (in: a-proteobacteria)]|nr:TetR/AcrR family transcriptional regulator [Paracoccus sp. (in: a-proteobacteria)]